MRRHATSPNPEASEKGTTVSSSSETASAGRRVVIVESPAKARTIKGYLGPDYVVESSVGHVRDLPNSAAEVPARYKKESWARLGVDVEHDFTPLYVVSADKRAQVSKLKKLLSGARELYLATDEDREGEAIAWHLTQVLEPKVPVRRMVFHEITRDAIRAAVRHSREINQRLVDAQETRRILDRLYGYEVSPVLWKKVMPRLSAGRVQSVATRLVVDRERERMAFTAAGYWDLVGVFRTRHTHRGSSPDGAKPDEEEGDDPHTLTARLVTVDGTRVTRGRDFSSDGQLRDSDLLHLDEAAAQALSEALANASFTVRDVEHKPYRRTPYPPFRTTTLQQEAYRKLGFGAKRTMGVAQRLYENGFTTYMRTDSITLSEAAIASARAQAQQLYGPEYLPSSPRRYSNKVKNAQEAHEAIRPAGDAFRTPAQTGLTGDEFRLYELIWMRTVASQMRDALGQSVTVRLGSHSADGRDVEFGVSGRVITFPGFLKAYVEGADTDDAELDDRERRLPDVTAGDPLTVVALQPEGHATKPPARYTEASLIKELEDREIGRPSTYAPILGTIMERGYVFKKGTALAPSFLAFAVVALLEQHFGHLIDYDFTARMEDDLDAIARGEARMVPWLRGFYFGESEALTGLKELVTDLDDIDARQINSLPLGNGIMVRVGRYGPYLERDSDRAAIPSDLAPDELTVPRAEDMLGTAATERMLGTDPGSGHTIVVKHGRYGHYVTEVLPDDAVQPPPSKPRSASLLTSMSPESMTLADALRLFSLPRVVGADPETREQITAHNGRYGPYLKKGTDSRSLPSEEQLFTVTLDEALAIFAEPKQRTRRAAPEPVKTLGSDPNTSRSVVVKSGRYGPYLTDGETNVTLRDSDEIESLTLERAIQLLAERRAAGPARKRTRAKGKIKAAAKK